ncbi:hypothetical protein V6N12_046252 [Hibiscus sabdariffa]|uniref:Reverse transcriptase Ty1/copia-type domain-containing protein n=1 Tax=Hibiscus sabdariffa TaxID=183260 RepID=A0ABR2BIM6_9ROSI
MRSEMDSMSENQVWTLVEPPEGIKPIGCKWVFKKKTDMDGNVQTYMGRLVAKVAAFHDYEIWQMDVKTAFLNGKLEEDVYMTQPEGFVTPENVGKANPGEGHWIVVKNILKYLRRTKDVFLVYGGEEELRIKGYTDASFQTDKDDSRSQSGFVFCLNGGAVSWKSSKQDTVADSTTEAEYIAASEAAKEAVWIKKFITELGVIPSIADAVDLYCDNNGAIAQAKEPRSHQRSKHILRHFHLIREIIDRGDVEICKVHTDDNIADPLTKPLAQQKHDRHTESLGIRYVGDWS